MKVTIVEKDYSFSQQLERDVKEIGFKVLNRLHSPTEVISTITKNLPDCVICASNLSERQSGFELAGSLSHLRLPFIFTDKEPNEENYIKAKGYPLGHYLIPPFSTWTLKSIIEDFDVSKFSFYASHIHRGKYIFLKRHSVFEKVNMYSISRIRSEGNYSIIYSKGRQYVIKFSLSKLLELPHFNSFFRIHRNYAVQKNKIIKVDFSNRICETEEESIPFGRTYTKSIRKVMNLPYNLI